MRGPTVFAQIIQARVADRAGVERAFERWRDELADGAQGWLGSTGGITDDDQLFVLARFESAAAAQRNSQRAEQGAWWDELSGHLDGDATFHDCDDVELMGEGGTDDAGFVQIIQFRSDDPDKLREMSEGMDDEAMREYRPDVIGGVVAAHGDGTFTQVVYFTSEAEAREGEQREPPPEVAERFADMDTLQRDVRYLDLTEPWLDSPAG